MKWIVRSGSLVDESIIEWEVEAECPAEAEEEGIILAKHHPAADEGNVWVRVKEEDRQLICDRLLDALQITRAFDDLLELAYFPARETVPAIFENGMKKTANVSGDSGIAMIRDIIAAIM